MELMSSYRREGREEGRAEGIQEGKESLVTRLITRRFGEVSSELHGKLDKLSPEQLDDLGVALFDFKTSTDLNTWLTQHTAQ